ncbi:MAG TPA: hypothetical protein VII50_12400, partial [Acidothermaceae bacterium]
GASSPLSGESSLQEFALFASATVTVLPSIETGLPLLFVKVNVNWTAGCPDTPPWPVPDEVMSWVPLTATVKAPTVGVAVDGTGVGLLVAVGVGTGVSLAGAEGDFDADGFGLALAVAFGVVPVTGVAAVAVGWAGVLADPDATAGTEAAGAEPATPVDDTAGLGSVLDAAAATGPDDAALLLCDELEHADSASAATTVTPTHPVTRKRTVMAFPPAGMRQQ